MSGAFEAIALSLPWLSIGLEHNDRSCGLEMGCSVCAASALYSSGLVTASAGAMCVLGDAFSAAAFGLETTIDESHSPVGAVLAGEGMRPSTISEAVYSRAPWPAAHVADAGTLSKR